MNEVPAYKKLSESGFKVTLQGTEQKSDSCFLLEKLLLMRSKIELHSPGRWILID
jgi:hypothetical protein